MNSGRVNTLFVLGSCAVILLALQGVAQTSNSSSPAPALGTAPDSSSSSEPSPTPSIPANAPHIARQTRLEIIRDFETQLVYARTAFPMGTKGLQLKQGTITPNGEELRQALAVFGPAIKPGDPAHISLVQIKDGYIHFEINGGPIRHKKWYQRVEISGTGGTATPTRPDDPERNPHGSFVNLYFDKYVPELTPQQLRSLLYPVLDFNSRNSEQAYLETVPPKVKEAIQAHNVLVGMNSEMVVRAKGKPPKKVRERDDEIEYEEWIYGEPPADVDFVRLVGDEVVRVETMKVGGQKVVRTEKEVILEPTDKDKEAKSAPAEKPAIAPTLRRPGEAPIDVPTPAHGAAPPPPRQPPPPDQQPGGPPGLLATLSL